MYNLSVQTFRIRSLITQDFWIVQIMAFLEFDKREVKAKIDFLISASKLEMLFNKHFAGTASSLETKYFTIHIIVCNSKLRECNFLVLSLKIRTIKCSTKLLLPQHFCIITVVTSNYISKILYRVTI